MHDLMSASLHGAEPRGNTRLLVSRDLHHLVSSPQVSFEFPKGEKHLRFKCTVIHRFLFRGAKSAIFRLLDLYSLFKALLKTKE